MWSGNPDTNDTRDHAIATPLLLPMPMVTAYERNSLIFRHLI